MKQGRQNRILDIIAKEPVETQEQLAELLKKEGYPVTQATVSRDIKELGLGKVPGSNGNTRYALIQKSSSQMEDKFVRVMRDGLISMDMAQNILVIKTVSGMAMAVAAAVDGLHFEEIVGCIAGDDTIMAAVRSVEDTKRVMEKIRSMLHG